jgi:hypothetical protein
MDTDKHFELLLAKQQAQAEELEKTKRAIADYAKTPILQALKVAQERLMAVSDESRKAILASEEILTVLADFGLTPKRARKKNAAKSDAVVLNDTEVSKILEACKDSTTHFQITEQYPEFKDKAKSKALGLTLAILTKEHKLTKKGKGRGTYYKAV